MNSAKPERLPIVMLCLLAAGAQATTPREQQLRAAPMPHVALGPGKTALVVDWVHLEGYYVGVPDNAGRLADLKVRMANCSASGRVARVDPPAAWPELTMSHRIEEYSSAQMSIAYHHALNYSIDAATCGLLESYQRTATLTSARGVCNIDLVTRTAVGACHPLGSSGEATSVERIRALSARLPGGSVARVPAIAPAPAKRKRILGIECTEWPNPFDKSGTMCLAPGRLALPAPMDDGGMLIERTSSTGMVSKAVEAGVGVQVNGAVFTPHLGGGFRINPGRGAR